METTGKKFLTLKWRSVKFLNFQWMCKKSKSCPQETDLCIQGESHEILGGNPDEPRAAVCNCKFLILFCKKRFCRNIIVKLPVIIDPIVLYLVVIQHLILNQVTPTLVVILNLVAI